MWQLQQKSFSALAFCSVALSCGSRCNHCVFYSKSLSKRLSAGLVAACLMVNKLLPHFLHWGPAQASAAQSAGPPRPHTTIPSICQLESVYSIKIAVGQALHVGPSGHFGTMKTYSANCCQLREWHRKSCRTKGVCVDLIRGPARARIRPCPPLIDCRQGRKGETRPGEDRQFQASRMQPPRGQPRADA